MREPPKERPKYGRDPAAPVHVYGVSNAGPLSAADLFDAQMPQAESASHPTGQSNEQRIIQVSSSVLSCGRNPTR